MVELKINGQQVELSENAKIKVTLQVHDIADLSTVNATYTNSFDLPKSPNNTALLDGLGIVGDTSIVPYTKVNAELSIGGLPAITKGWLDIKSTADKYKVSIIDGIIDLFKAIENKKFGSDIPLPETIHDKNMESVVDSFDDENLRYIIGEFGGKTTIFSGFPDLYYTNIDYLVPFIRFKYLWDKIFQYANFTYSGSIFEHEDFQNAWISFPKSTAEITEDLVRTMELVYMPDVGVFPSFHQFIFQNNEWILRLNPVFTPPGFESTEIIPNKIGLEPWPQFGRFQRLLILESGSYNIHLDFDVTAEYRFPTYPPGTATFEFPVKLKISKNGSFYRMVMPTEENTIITFSGVAVDELSFDLVLMSREEIQAYLEWKEEELLPNNIGYVEGARKVVVNSWEMEINEVNFIDLPFEDALKDLTPKDVLKECMTRFGLTPIPDRYENHVTFYKIDELLNIENSEDWSDKYVERTNETYTYNGYAQNNEFKHKYTQEAVNYNDGRLIVSNQNLDDIKAFYSSKLYSPEQEFTSFMMAYYSIPEVYPTLIWDKDFKEDDDGEVVITYKGGTGRFFWVKSQWVESNVTLVSELLAESETVTGFPFVNTYMTTYNDLVPIYYEKYNQLLNNTRVHEIDLMLSIADIISLDFTKPKYFAQEQSYYKLNKIIFEEGKVSKGEFIKLNPTI